MGLQTLFLFLIVLNFFDLSYAGETCRGLSLRHKNQTISTRVFRANLKNTLDRVYGEELSFLISRNGKVRAKIEPVTDDVEFTPISEITDPAFIGDKFDGERIGLATRNLR